MIFSLEYLSRPCSVFHVHVVLRLGHLHEEDLRRHLPVLLGSYHGLHRADHGSPDDGHLHNGKNVSDGHHNLWSYGVSLEVAHVFRPACLHSDPCLCRDLCNPYLYRGLCRRVLMNDGVRLDPRDSRLGL